MAGGARRIVLERRQFETSRTTLGLERAEHPYRDRSRIPVRARTPIHPLCAPSARYGSERQPKPVRELGPYHAQPRSSNRTAAIPGVLVCGAPPGAVLLYSLARAHFDG